MDMLDVENWDSRSMLVDFLSERLACGHVLPFLGSGISLFANLPNWRDLIEKVARTKDPTYGMTGDAEPYATVEQILQRLFRGDRQLLYRVIHRLLYEETERRTLANMIHADKGMRALTMLCHSSVRGGSRFILTLNYDNILEVVLRDLSLVVQSVGSDRFLFGDYDVSVLHPHGLLEIDEVDRDYDRRVVITQSDHLSVSRSSWKPLIELLLSKSFPMFIGIGGSDIRLLDYLDGSEPMNYSHSVRGLPYVGVRLCSRTDANIEVFESKRIKCITFDRLGEEWPAFVEDICRTSARRVEARMASL